MTMYGQVGIGTENPNPSAILDLEANNKGILIPRVALTGLTDNTTISEGNVESILVYNTTVSSELKKGYYYWSGTQWEMLANQSYQNWNCQGNSNTNPVSHFMGTTDNKELWFRTNNINRLRIGLETANSSFNTVHARFYQILPTPEQFQELVMKLMFKVVVLAVMFSELKILCISGVDQA